MPHHPEPFYRSARKGWFVQVGKRQIPLGIDQEPKRDRKTGRPIPSQEILDRYHETMRRRDEFEGLARRPAPRRWSSSSSTSSLSGSNAGRRNGRTSGISGTARRSRSLSRGT